MIKKYFEKFWWLVPVVSISVAIGVAAKIVYDAKSQPETLYQMVDCTGASAGEYGCWKQRLEAIVINDSPKEAFDDIKQAYQTNEYVKSQCHQLSHVVGRIASKKYGDIGTTYNQGDNFCWSGFYHGVLENVIQTIGAQNLVDKIGTICETASNPKYSFYHYNCVHGLGHGVMLVENNDVPKSLAICDGLSDSWEQSSCQGGVFMENIMSFLNPDHHTDYIKADDPAYPCTEVMQRYQTQCWLMQTSHALNVYERDFNKVFALCASQKPPNDQTCYASTGRDASGSTVSDVQKTLEICQLGKTYEAIKYCAIGASSDFVSYFHDDKKAYELCAGFSDSNVASECKYSVEAYYRSF